MGNPHMEGVGCSSSRLGVKISDFWSLGQNAIIFNHKELF